MADNSSQAEHIAEFARNEMVRADHTISWAGDVAQCKAHPDYWQFNVRHMGEVYTISVARVVDVGQ